MICFTLMKNSLRNFVSCAGLTLLSIFSHITLSQNSKKIEIVSTDLLEYNKKTGTEAKKLIGNVCFRHEQAVMFCDSAYFFTEDNKVDAFGNVSIHQGDTLHLYGKSLHYEGNNKTVEIKENVRLVDKQTTLTTDFLTYIIDKKVGFYYGGGNIVNANNKLKSREGYYYTDSKTFFFKGNVEIINPQYTIYSDTLQYNTILRTAYFFGPTKIISQTNLIYCENGWYNTQKNTSKFYRNAYLTGNKRFLKGDSLLYNRNKGMGKAYGNVLLIDSSRNVILSGHYAYYEEFSPYAFITDSATLTLYNEKDSLYLHADTLQMFTLNDSAQNKLIKAYYHAKFFKTDIQGRADSITFSTIDSTLHLFYRPILWSGNNQITAKKIELHFSKQQIQSIDFFDDAFIISKEDIDKYSQVKGKNMKGFFHNNELYRLHVSGNGQTLYYAKEKNQIIGVNRAVCSQINVFINKQKISRIVFLSQPDATFYPLHKMPEEDKILKGFIWYETERPLNRFDIYRK